jgi:hypothetical protein
MDIDIISLLFSINTIKIAIYILGNAELIYTLIVAIILDTNAKK